MESKILEIYGKRLRTRVCGLCWHDDRLLLVNHKMPAGDFWAPPGGGIEFGESLEVALKREFLEETGLEIELQTFAFGCEFIQDPLHAIELFFSTECLGGVLKTGADPELQVIGDVKFMTELEMESLPPDALHGILRLARNRQELSRLSGFYRL